MRMMRENRDEPEGFGEAFGFHGAGAAQMFQARQPPRQDRDPLPEEIETVTVMGYSVEEADAALRMANFDIQQAIEMLLTNVEEVVAFSERRLKEKQDELRRKEQEEIEAAMQKSLGIEE